MNPCPLLLAAHWFFLQEQMPGLAYCLALPGQERLDDNKTKQINALKTGQLCFSAEIIATGFIAW